MGYQRTLLLGEHDLKTHGMEAVLRVGSSASLYKNAFARDCDSWAGS